METNEYPSESESSEECASGSECDQSNLNGSRSRSNAIKKLKDDSSNKRSDPMTLSDILFITLELPDAKDVKLNLIPQMRMKKMEVTPMKKPLLMEKQPHRPSLA
ncbi:hypothetical protein ACS0TY_018870 [Phlomoides rotata]